MEGVTLEEKLAAAGDLAGYINKPSRDRFTIGWHDRSLPGKGPTAGNSNPGSREIYRFLGYQECGSWEEAADLVEKLTGRRPRRYGSISQAKIIEALADLTPRARERAYQTAMRKAGWPPKMRKARIALDGGKCQYRSKWCADRLAPDFPCPQVDHVDPDGDHSIENGQTVCPSCHAVKHHES